MPKPKNPRDSRYVIRSREDVDRHRIGYGYNNNSLPAVNVKDHGDWGRLIDWEDVFFQVSDATYDVTDPAAGEERARAVVEWARRTIELAGEAWHHGQNGAAIDAQNMVTNAEEWAREWWWGDVSEWATYNAFPDDDVKVWSEGRSGGWLVVEGLPDVETWDAIALGRWRSFVSYVGAMVAYWPTQVAAELARSYGVRIAEEADRETVDAVL